MKTFALGLVLLIPQGYEDTIKKLVDDLSKAETASAKVGVGDEYVKLAKKYPKKRQELVDAASDCYTKAWDGLDDFWKTEVRKCLVKLYAPVVPGRAGSLLAGWGGPVDPFHKAILSTERVHSGGVAAKLVPGAKAKNARLLFTPTVALKPGKKVEYSLWVLSDGTDSLDDRVRFYFNDAEGKLIGAPEKPIPKDVPIWRRLSLEIDFPEGAARANIEVVVFSTKGVVFVDDLSIRVDGKEILDGGFEGK